MVREVTWSFGVLFFAGLTASGVVADPVAGEQDPEPYRSLGIGPFESIGPTLCGSEPKTRDEFARIMGHAGFKRSSDGSSWELTEPAGTTRVSTALPALRQVIIVFIPAQRAALPGSIIGALTSKARSVSFIPPDKLSFEFPELAKLEGCSMNNEVMISLKDGAWLETDEALVWGRKP